MLWSCEEHKRAKNEYRKSGGFAEYVKIVDSLSGAEGGRKVNLTEPERDTEHCNAITDFFVTALCKLQRFNSKRKKGFVA